MAAFVTAHFRAKFGARDDNIIKIVWEKTYCPWMIWKKKRYAGLIWKERVDPHTGVASMPTKPKLSLSGMDTERRDTCPFIAAGVRRVIEMLLSTTTTSGSRVATLGAVRTFVRTELIDRFDAGRVPWNELIQSMQYRKRAVEYTAGGSQPPHHIVVVLKEDARLAAGIQTETHNPGDRVPFIVTEGAVAGMRSSECAENPMYAWAQHMRPSREHYLVNGVEKTMARILGPVLQRQHASRRLDGTQARAMQLDDDDAQVLEWYRQFMNEDSTPTTLRAAGAAATEATPLVVVHAPRRGALYNVATVRRRCRRCGVPLDSADAACPCALAAGAVDGAAATAAAAAAAAERARVTETRDRLARTCQACKAEKLVAGKGGGAALDDATLAAMPGLGTEAPDDVVIERALPCDSSTCEFQWQRLFADRLWSTLRGAPRM
jgi:hypothetical protein